MWKINVFNGIDFVFVFFWKVLFYSTNFIDKFPLNRKKI